MALKDLVGMLCICAGLAVWMMKYQPLGVPWFLAAPLLGLIGYLCIWSARRERKIADALDQVPDPGPGRSLFRTRTDDLPDVDAD